MEQKTIMNRKGVLDMGMVKLVFISIMLLGIIGFVLVFVLAQINTISVLTPTESAGLTITNQTQTFVAAGNGTSNNSLRNIALSNVVIINATNSTQPNIPASNFTISGGTITAEANSLFIDGTVNISYDYSYKPRSDSENLESNLSGAIADDFFGKIGSVFSILIAVVIIMAIVLLFMAVRRVTGSNEEGGL